ncbi:helix-turn-helix domain-containing protein [Paraburkholderia oxyphila]|uniref:helix-turn-helix domain-containing protein n=1 Tax=Paraburkholderia oxyphila TaxID=614212 RepID=UPI0005B8C99B|nr:helix-turn-helix domain-containing protein [Paraburkholderia oxyphila]
MSQIKSYEWMAAFKALPRKAMDTHTRAILFVIATFLNDKEGKPAFPSTETIAEQAGMSKRAALEHIGKAEQAGWLRITQARGNGQAWRRNEYHPVIPKGAELPPETDSAQGGDAGSPALPTVESDAGKVVTLTQGGDSGDTDAVTLTQKVVTERHSIYEGNYEYKTRSFAIAHEPSAAGKSGAPTIDEYARPAISVHCQSYCETHGIKDPGERWAEFGDMVLSERPDLAAEPYGLPTSNAFRSWVQGRREWNMRTKPWAYRKERASAAAA